MDELIQRAVELPWGYIMSTLIIRFVGVFFVLAILMAGMILLGKIVSGIIARQEKKSSNLSKKELPTVALTDIPEGEAGEEEIVAAMGAALAFALQTEQAATAASPQTGVSAGAWTLAGRTAQMDRRLQGGSYHRSLK